MRRLLNLLTVPLLTAPIVLLAGSNAMAATGPTIQSIDYAAYAGDSLAITAVVTDTAALDDAEIVATDERTQQELDVPADITPSSTAAHSVTGHVDTRLFANGDPLVIEAVVTDVNGDSDDAVSDGTAYVDHSRPTVVFAPTNSQGQYSSTITDAFSAQDENPGVTTTCALDGALPLPCTSPARFVTQTAGEHMVRVTATDAAGNSSSQALQTSIAPANNNGLVVSGFPTQSPLLGSIQPFTVVMDPPDYDSYPVTGIVTVSSGSGRVYTATLLAGPGPAPERSASFQILVDRPSDLLTISYAGDASIAGASTLYHYYATSQLTPRRETGKASVVAVNRAGTFVRVTLRCPISSSGCKGTMSLGASRISYAMLPGQTHTYRIALPKNIARTLVRHHKVRTTLVLVDASRRNYPVKLG